MSTPSLNTIDVITRVVNLSKHPMFKEQTDLKAWPGAINDLRILLAQLRGEDPTEVEDDGVIL